MNLNSAPRDSTPAESAPGNPRLARLGSGTRLRDGMRLLNGLAAVAFIGLFLFTSLRRLHYPFDLEWVENGMMISVSRVAHGLPLFVKPTLDFVSYGYTPLYYFVSAAATHLFGVSYTALRAVSIASVLLSLGVLYAVVFKETRRHLAALMAAGLYAALYGFCNGWFDLGRVDSLFVLLTLAALFCSRFGSPALAAVFWFLSFETKQSVLPAAILMLCWDSRWVTHFSQVSSRTPRGGGFWVKAFLRPAIGLALFVGLAAATHSYFNHTSDGWFGFYVFGLLGSVPLDRTQAEFFLSHDLLQPLGIAMVPILGAVLLSVIRRGAVVSEAATSANRAKLLFYLLASASLAMITFSTRMHHLAAINSLMPLYAFVAIGFGIAFARLSDFPWPDSASGYGSVLLLAASLIQFASLLYRPSEFIPSSADFAIRQRVHDVLKEIPGDVWLTDANWDASTAGKAPHAAAFAVLNVMGGSEPAVAADLRRHIDDALQQRKFSAMIFSDSISRYFWLPSNFDRLYPVRCFLSDPRQATVVEYHPILIALPAPNSTICPTENWSRRADVPEAPNAR